LIFAGRGYNLPLVREARREFTVFGSGLHVFGTAGIDSRGNTAEADTRDRIFRFMTGGYDRIRGPIFYRATITASRFRERPAMAIGLPFDEIGDASILRVALCGSPFLGK
jgi:hypothetical protein